MATHKGPANGRDDRQAAALKRKARPGAGHSVYDCGRSGMKTTANEPGQTKPVRVARREALPHLRKEMRILNDDGSAPWRAIPSHPEGTGTTGLPGASIKNTGDGAWLKH